MMRFLAAARRSCNSSGKIQALLMFLMGLGFMVLGLRTYPAFIGAGGLFLVIGYRGLTSRTEEVTDRE